MKNLFTLSLLALVLGCGQSQKNTHYYAEQHRPQFHFSPEKGWMNDPNGLVYYAGEYHLFYQHYPDSTIWGPMHWGHAISKDLLHWEHQPIALYPDSLGYIFSGSIVIDENNTTGFQKGTEKPLVAIFTYHNMAYEKAGRSDRESQGIAFSLDKGRTWTKYEKNPVLPNQGATDFRDPKVFWHEASKHWVMPLATGQHLEIYTSPNLKDWKKASDFGEKDGSHGGVWECPDLFPIKTKEGVQKWVLIQNIGRGAVNGGSGTQYFVGEFDGQTFKNDNAPEATLWLDYGADNYAGITWFNAPNNRRILIGWMSNWDDYATTVPTSTWRSACTVPRELSLVPTPQGYRLCQVPVEEFDALRGKPSTLQVQSFEKTLKIAEASVLKELNVSFDMTATQAQEIGFEIGNSRNEKLVFGYDTQKKQLFINRTQSGKVDFSTKFAKVHTAPYEASKSLNIRALIDKSSIEVFVDGGKIAFTEVFFPNEDFTQTQLYTKGGKAQLLNAEVYPLRSIWEK